MAPRRSRALSNALNKVFEAAFKEAENFKDEYVSTEHLLLGVAQPKSDPARRRWRRWARRTKRFLKALTAVRGIQRVTDQNPEGKVSGAGEIREGSDRTGAARQARSGDRARRRDSARDPGA